MSGNPPFGKDDWMPGPSGGGIRGDVPRQNQNILAFRAGIPEKKDLFLVP